METFLRTLCELIFSCLDTDRVTCRWNIFSVAPLRTQQQFLSYTTNNSHSMGEPVVKFCLDWTETICRWLIWLIRRLNHQLCHIQVAFPSHTCCKSFAVTDLTEFDHKSAEVFITSLTPPVLTCWGQYIFVFSKNEIGKNLFSTVVHLSLDVTLHLDCVFDWRIWVAFVHITC